MKRLTWKRDLDGYTDVGLRNGVTESDAIYQLAAYEDTGLGPERVMELAQAEKDGRLVVLEPVARAGEKKPPCFYNDMGQTFCLGFARGEYDDEPIDRCKECWYCQSTREEAEAALKKREEDDEKSYSDRF